MLQLAHEYETCHHEMRVKLQNYFLRFVQIQNAQKTSFKMICNCNMLTLITVFPVKTLTEGQKFLCFLLIMSMCIEPYVLTHTGDLTLILWWQVSFVTSSREISHMSNIFNFDISSYVISSFKLLQFGPNPMVNGLLVAKLQTIHCI